VRVSAVFCRKEQLAQTVTARSDQARTVPPFGADIALMPAGIWLAHIGMFGAE
jgi:hypothetical protein